MREKVIATYHGGGTGDADGFAKRKAQRAIGVRGTTFVEVPCGFSLTLEETP